MYAGRKVSGIPQSIDAAGTILLMNREEGSLEKQAFSHPAQPRRPVAVIDQIGGWRLCDYVPPDALIRVFAMSVSQRPGTDVARYLLEMGHRHIAFVTPYGRHVWSRNRCAGCTAAFNAAGLSDHVHVFTPSPIDAEEATKHSIDDLIPLVNMLLGAGDMIPGFLRSDFSSYLSAENLRRVYRGAQTGRILAPLFGKMLDDTRITAWVTVNDAVAFHALDFLSERGVRVPEDISLISFDDTFEASQRNLSSYNFNIPGVVHAVMSYLLNPQRFSAARFGTEVELDGVVVTRKSCGRPGR
jgi:DNA-binding LacI/PurR family transcriptional regulator